nr:MAG TPA: hypothetical protein [Bacteriophage sp.]
MPVSPGCLRSYVFVLGVTSGGVELGSPVLYGLIIFHLLSECKME